MKILGLNSLPNELLYEIAKWLYFSEPKYTPLRNKRFRATYVLSCVNHRLRQITKPLLKQDLHYETDEAASAHLFVDMDGCKGAEGALVK